MPAPEPPDAPRPSRLSRFRRVARVPAAFVTPSRRLAPTVLVVDDVEAIRVLVRAALEPEFAVIGEAGDGAEAVALAEELQPDVVLLDLNMPKHDGLEAIGTLLAVAPATRIVVLSGLPAEVIADKALKLGAHRFVAKTDPVSELAGTLRSVLR